MSRRASVVVVLVALGGLGGGGCSMQVDADNGPVEHVGADVSELFGCVAESRMAPFVQATARLDFDDGNMCSGTLVSANQVLTAAHCFCGAQTGFVRFAENNGSIGAGARAWPITSVLLAPNVQNSEMCGDAWSDSSEDDPAYHEPFDIALVGIGPDATGLPPFAPSPMFLGDAGVALNTLSLRQNVWGVGYGSNAPAPILPKSDTCLGCSIRRSGPIGEVRYGADPCEYVFGIPLEEDCYDSPLWVAKSVAAQNQTEPAQGDSGGGLFFNIDIACTDSSQGTALAGVLGGVYSGFYEADETRARWAPLGHEGRLICDSLNVPAARTLVQQRSDAVTATNTIELNDRARVVSNSAGTIGSTISAGGRVILGVESFVGAINSNDNVWLRERAVVSGVVRATFNVTTQNGATIGGRLDGLCTKFEPWTVVAPFPAGTQDRVLEPIQGQSVTSYALNPINNIRDLSIRRGVRLTLSAGLYVFRNIDLAPGAELNVAANTWIYLVGTDSQRFRGDIFASANSVFWGIPNAQWVHLGGQWEGALVAPNASVIGDMRDLAVLAGNFFVKDFTLHQGRWLIAVPYLGPWVPSCDVNRTNCH